MLSLPFQNLPYYRDTPLGLGVFAAPWECQTFFPTSCLNTLAMHVYPTWGEKNVCWMEEKLLQRFHLFGQGFWTTIKFMQFLEGLLVARIFVHIWETGFH